MENPLKPNVRLIPAEEVIRDEQLSNKVSVMMDELKNETVRFPSLHVWDSLVGINLYIIFDEDEGNPVGLIGWIGPTDEATPRWWIRPSSRRKGYGSPAVEKLAEEMHRKGVTQIREIEIHTKTVREHMASRKLAHRLRKCFSKLKG